MDYRLERSGGSGSIRSPGRAELSGAERSEAAGEREREGEREGGKHRLAIHRAPGAIYLANLCHVIGNFIIFLEASQSRSARA